MNLSVQSLIRTFLLLLALFLTSCTPTLAEPEDTAVPQATPSRVLPTVAVKITPAPSAENAADEFLQDWKAEDYSSMYDRVASQWQNLIPFEDFAQTYKDASIQLTLDSLDYQIKSSRMDPSSAQVISQITYHTHLVGDISTEITMMFRLESGAWKILWDRTLIMPELQGGNKLQIIIQSPERGIIYDKNGSPIAANGNIVSLGVIKGQTNPKQENSLVQVLAKLTSQPRAWVRAAINDESVYVGYYIPIGEALEEDVREEIDVLRALDGVTWQEYQGRYYPYGGIATHVTGYVASVPAGQEEAYQRQGFNPSDRVGQNGIEYWGEAYLVGQRGADLRVVDDRGNIAKLLARVDAKPAQSISLTIDSQLQLETQRAIEGFDGAIVILERDTGRVLAMVSSPGFDPNAFECGDNFVNGQHCQALLEEMNSSNNPSYNRATGNGYPPGSVFKLITMAAGLESGLVDPEETIDCQYEYVIDGTVLYDWTKEKDYPPSGVLDLYHGLVRSCNPWFYHIGEVLYKQGHPLDISNMARAFGLGSKTGLEGVTEEAGNIAEPTDPVEAGRVAIGQNTMLSNPLQVARFIAALGNGGTLYRPQVIEKITGADGEVSQAFQPDASGTLPVKEENLQMIQDAMRSVVSNENGTAADAFSGLRIPLHGKTGTAQVDFNDPNAWFAGYTNAQRTDRPDIAFAVVVENGGEGSEIAAPIARRIVEVYFFGEPQRLYPWESGIYVTKTPEPEDEE